MCQCGERLPDGGAGRCAACGATYRVSGGAIEQVTGPNLGLSERER
jgi:hypothetical protein